MNKAQINSYEDLSRYIELNGNRVTVMPGEVYLGQQNDYIYTLLGSCIAITVWHPRYKIGGMCHYLLPDTPQGDGNDLDGRYAEDAFKLLKEKIVKTNTNIGDYQVKMFGGASTLGLAVAEGGRQPIGTRNATKGMEMIVSHNLELLVAHVGESGHRKIVLDNTDGSVWVYHELNSGELMESISGAC